MRFILGMVLLACSAAANPRMFPFSYQVETLGRGEAELEQFVDMTWVRSFDFTGAAILEPRWVLQTEVEAGITERLEGALYLVASSTPGLAIAPAPLVFDGLRARVRYRLTEPEAVVDVGLYLELSMLRNEIELEGKVLLQKRFGAFRAVANLWLEHEWYFNGRREWVLHPTAGFNWEITPQIQVGLEYWLTAELTALGPQNADEADAMAAKHFVGPVWLLQVGKVWWSAGVYVRLDALGRPLREGDLFGRWWVRTALGISL